MISDSVPWRAELARITARLRRRLTQQRWREETFYLVERDLLVGMFTIRRLIEAQKSSSLLPLRRLPVRVLPLTGREPLRLDRWSPWEHYDFGSRQRGEIDVQTLFHEFIHSFILMLGFEEDGRTFCEVYVGSDRTKRRHIYEIPIQSIIDLFDHVSCEHVVRAWNWDAPPPTSFRLSQHDLVEAGFAEYDPEDRWVHTDVADITEDYMRTNNPHFNVLEWRTREEGRRNG